MTHPDLDVLDKLLEEATGGPWELQDGSSWRRIGTRYSGGNGNVLCPSTYSSTDNHPDLVAGRGEDVYANLRLIVAAVNTLPSLIAELRRLRAALDEIVQLKPQEFKYPDDWEAQIAACPECESYRNHPIQQGICNTHRRPVWNREKHDSHEEKAIGYRAKAIARAAREARDGR